MIPFYRVAAAMLLMCVYGGLWAQTDKELKDDAVHRVVFAHDPALFVAIGALYLKQEALRSAGGKTLTPALEDEVDRLIGLGVRDAAWFYKGWSGAIEKYLSAEDADEIAVHFTTEGGRLQQRVIELAVAEVLASIYTFTDKIDYRITASKRELLELQSAMDQRLLKGIQDFSVYPNAVKFASSGAGVKYMKMLMIQGVGVMTDHFEVVAESIRQAVQRALAADRPHCEEWCVQVPRVSRGQQRSEW